MLLNQSYAYYALVVPVLAMILFAVNKYLSMRNVYSDKLSPFECGLSSFNQTRSSFNVAFILIALLFLPFDLEISSLLPYALVLYQTGAYGLTVIIVFTLILVVGFYYEYNNSALTIKKDHIKSLAKYSLDSSLRNKA